MNSEDINKKRMELASNVEVATASKLDAEMKKRGFKNPKGMGWKELHVGDHTIKYSTSMKGSPEGTVGVQHYFPTGKMRKTGRILNRPGKYLETPELGHHYKEFNLKGGHSVDDVLKHVDSRIAKAHKSTEHSSVEEASVEEAAPAKKAPTKKPAAKKVTKAPKATNKTAPTSAFASAHAMTQDLKKRKVVTPTGIKRQVHHVVSGQGTHRFQTSKRTAMYHTASNRHSKQFGGPHVSLWEHEGRTLGTVKRVAVKDLNHAHKLILKHLSGK